MISVKVETTVPTPFHIVADNFSEELFVALAPSFPPSRLISFDGDRIGGLVKIELGISPASQLWISEIVSRSESAHEIEFVDKGIQLPPPLKEWEHRHVIRKQSESETIVIDDFRCTSGSKWIDMGMKPFISAMFRQRSPVYKKYFSEKLKKNA